MGSPKKKDFMLKRSVNKNWITAQNYKSRWFVLDESNLNYHNGTLEKVGKIKGSIKLEKIKVVEAVEDRVLDNKVNVFQIVYAEGEEFYTQYVVALKDEQRQEWIKELREAAARKDANFFSKYHSGVWTKALGRYSCCDQTHRAAVGCMLTTLEQAYDLSRKRFYDSAYALSRKRCYDSSYSSQTRSDSAYSSQARSYGSAYSSQTRSDSAYSSQTRYYDSEYGLSRTRSYYSDILLTTTPEYPEDDELLSSGSEHLRHAGIKYIRYLVNQSREDLASEYIRYFGSEYCRHVEKVKNRNAREKNIKAASRLIRKKEDKNKQSYGGWFYKLDIRCDQLYVHCIIDERLENRYTYLKQHYDAKMNKSVLEFLRSFDTVLENLKVSWESPLLNDCWDPNYPRPREFEILFYLKIKVSSKLSNTELLKIALNQSQPLLCRWLLMNLKQFKIEPDLLLTLEENEIFTPMAWYITRLFYQTYNARLKEAYSIWPGRVCCCPSSRSVDSICAKNSRKLIIVQSNQKLENLPTKYFGLEIYNHVKSGNTTDREFCSILKRLLLKNEDSYYMHSAASSKIAEYLFKAHKNLTLVSSFPFKSKGFGSKHQIYRSNIIQLFCKKKGIIPIGENHFPHSINGFETDVLEAYPTLAVNLKVGDAIGPTNSKGTLGGFYEYMGRPCFLTCAHVMYDVQNLLKSAYDVTRNEAVKAFLHTPNGQILCGSTIRRIFEHDDNKVTSVDAALVEIDLSTCIVDPNDYVRGFSAHNFHCLGMASIYLNDNIVDHTNFANASQVQTIALGSMSTPHQQPVDYSMTDDTDVFFNNIGPVVAHVNGTVIPQLIFLAPVHMQATVGPIPVQRIFRMYKQMIVNIPLQAGDSGTGIYIVGGPGRTGCVGMAIAFCAGFSIVTPLKEIMSRL